MSVTTLRQYTTEEWDMATLGQLGVCIMALREIPAEDLADLCLGDATAYLTLYGAHKAIEEKLYQISMRMKL